MYYLCRFNFKRKSSFQFKMEFLIQKLFEEFQLIILIKLLLRVVFVISAAYFINYIGYNYGESLYHLSSSLTN